MNQLRKNKAKETLQAGGTIFTSSVRLPEPGLCELLGYAGFDFVLIDCEHGAADPSSIDALVTGCFAGGTVPVVRVLRNDVSEEMMRALDLGAQGILIPHCRTVADALRLQQATSYPPRGIRGFGPGRGAKWGLVSSAEYFESVEDTILTIALIEDPEGVRNVDDIAAVGLDILWVGTSDLACALGCPGKPDHPLVLDEAKRVLEACNKFGIACGFPARDVENAIWARNQGFRAIGFGCAEQYVMQASRAFLQATRST